MLKIYVVIFLKYIVILANIIVCSPKKQVLFLAHFSDETTKAERGEATYTSSVC